MVAKEHLSNMALDVFSAQSSESTRIWGSGPKLLGSEICAHKQELTVQVKLTREGLGWVTLDKSIVPLIPANSWWGFY